MLGGAPIVAGTISLALGSALAASIRKDNRVTISFFGDGATGEGVLYESMNFAALKKLPIIFACENNLYATHMPIRECRVENNIFKIAEPFCIESHEVDGNDVLEVYESGQRAIKKCRSGEGPVFLEFLTYRFRGHVGPDDNIQGTHTDIRSKEEVKKWLERDPIKRFEKYLMDNRLMNEQELYNIKQEVRREVDEAHIFAKDNPLPDINELTKYVYR
jgi:pyruvate dehydrogenase E1 component alpha subunit